MEIEQRSQQRQRRHRVLAARFGQRQRRGQHRAAHAKAQRIDLRLLGDVAGHAQRLQHSVVQVVRPGGAVHAVGIGSDRIAPGNQEDRVTLPHRVTHEGVLGLQVQDVELVDVRRHDDQRPFVHGGGRGRVLDELEQLVFEHHVAGGRGHVAADLELGLVGLCDAALLHVAQQIGQPFVKRAARAFDDGLLGIGIKRQEIGR